MVHTTIKFPKEWELTSKPTNTNIFSFLESQLSHFELRITTTSTLDLLSKIHSKHWTSLQVLLAFAHRAIIAHQITSPLTEFFLEKAIERAKRLDEYLNETGHVVGPLHGLPISLKDEFDIKGIKTTLGVESLLDSTPLEQSSPVVDILYASGAVLFTKTNVPIAAFNTVTYNNVFGETVNPYNTNFNSGGSSGGEASLLAVRGAALGVGTDLGGSIRQPCSFQGVYGFKPTSSRVPHFNSKIVVKGMESLKGTNGPIANDIDALELYLKTIIRARPWEFDTNVVPIEWRDNETKMFKAPKFAIVLDDGIIKPLPPVLRALELIRNKLKEAGIEVIEWSGPELSSVAKFADIFMTSDGCTRLEEYTGVQSNHTDIKVSELWDLQQNRTELVNSLWKYWKSQKIDGLISPVSAFAGIKKDDFKDITYSPLANVLDFPAVTFPVTRASKTQDEIDDIGSVQFRNEIERQVWESYDPKESDGVPVGLQIIGEKFQEEKLVGLLRFVDQIMNVE